MHQTYKDRAAFLFVYIQEAHPTDGWPMESNAEEDIVIARPQKLEQRQVVAKACCDRLDITMPTVVDTIDNRVDELYAAWPERIFVIDRDGRVAYASQQGPWGFKPKEAERALRKLLR